jgi:serine/threonine protein kinase
MRDGPTAPTKKKKSVLVPVVIALVSAFLAVLVGTMIAVSLARCFYRVSDDQLQTSENLHPPQVIQEKILTANGNHKSNINFNKAMEVVIDPSNVVLKTRFSTYYKAVMNSRASYFIKKLNWSYNSTVFQLGSRDDFEREIEALGKLNNSNVMTPLAYVLTADSAFLFYEYAEKGTLYDSLHGSLDSIVDWGSRYCIAVGIAQGLAFLHGCASGPILLLDISSKNILLKSLKEPVIGDIELTKLIDPSKSTSSLSAVAGSVGYIPPEYAYTMRMTLAGNIYSFGVILLELLTGKPAVGDRIELAKWVLSFNHSRLDRILDSKVSITSVAVRNQMLAVLKIALACVNASPEARPKTKSLLRMLLEARSR